MLEDYDAALALDVSTPYLDTVALARGMCDAAGQAGKPVAVNSWPAGSWPSGGLSEEQGNPNYATGERAVTVLARMAERGLQTAARGPSRRRSCPAKEEKSASGSRGHPRTRRDGVVEGERHSHAGVPRRRDARTSRGGSRSLGTGRHEGRFAGHPAQVGVGGVALNVRNRRP